MQLANKYYLGTTFFNRSVGYDAPARRGEGVSDEGREARRKGCEVFFCEVAFFSRCFNCVEFNPILFRV